jgi:hypothetical protein
MGKKRKQHKRSAKAGLPPGSLVLIGNQRDEPVSIELIDYSTDVSAFEEVANVEDLSGSLLTLPFRG